MAEDLLVLVDGSSYLYRAFHALPPLSTSRGEPTGAIHGFIAMLRRLLKDYTPNYLAVVFDAKGKTFRDDMYPAYKAHRPAMPEELRLQVEPLHAVVRAMGVPMLVIEGVEADDVIGTLAVQAAEVGLRTLIATGDKDFAQVVSEAVSLVNTMDNSVMDAQGVERKFGVPPALIVDYLSLIGDKIDNVPGVPKVGPKTAVAWLKQYRCLDNLLAHAADIKGTLGDSLRASMQQLVLSKKLVTIARAVPLDATPRDLKPRPQDNETLKALFTELEFKTWLNDLLEDEPRPEPPVEAAGYATILDRGQLDRWIERLRHAELIAFDTETTSLDYMQAALVGVSFSLQAGEAAYVPVAHDYQGAPRQLSREEVLEALRPILEDPQRPKLGHNLKYDMSVLANHGVELRGIRCDSMLESYVLDSTASRHDLDSLALKYLGVRTILFEDVAGKGSNQLSFNQVPIDRAAAYSAEDAEVCLRLHQTFWPRLAEESGLRRLYEEMEVPLVPVLSRMERNGVQVDAEMLREQSRALGGRLLEVEAEAHGLAGERFNLESPKQILEILYHKLGLPIRAKTPTGQPSTGEPVLQDLAAEYLLPRLILEYRGLAKLKSTYTDKLPRQINVRTGRVHTSYHQAVAATGRLSSSDPNLQNIPVRTEEGRRIRRAFMAPPGSRLVAADYSQIELRIMAHLSADPLLRQAFAAGQDVHRATAAEIFGLKPETVGAEQRRAAKAINFGLIYGMSAFGLARQLGIDRGAAQDYIDRYFSRYPGVKAFMEETRVRARRQGYVETVYHRRLYLPEINSRNTQRRQYAERTAINAPMQGTAADIIKRAMIEVDRWLHEERISAKLIMQVHDELVLEVEEDAVEQVRARLASIMAGAAELAAPLVVDIGVGANWDEAH
ncbi:MAG: DNA polymerase I [Gammaproteobacteria bacterium]